MKETITYERINELLDGLSMYDFMQCVIKTTPSTEKFIRIKPNKELLKRGFIEPERKIIERWTNEKYIEWFKHWEIPEQLNQLQINLFKIGEYYKHFIQGYLGAIPDLLRENVYDIMPEISQMTLNLLGENIVGKEQFILTLLTNTQIPKNLSKPFMEGIRNVHLRHYDQVVYDFIEGRLLDLQDKDIYAFGRALNLEGVRDPLWFKQYFESENFQMRVLNQLEAENTFLDYVINQEITEKGIKTRHQFLSKIESIRNHTNTLNKIVTTPVGKQSIRFHNQSLNLLVSFEKDVIMSYTHETERNIIYKKPQYVVTNEEIAYVVKNLLPKLGKDVLVISVLLKNLRWG